MVRLNTAKNMGHSIREGTDRGDHTEKWGENKALLRNWIRNENSQLHYR